MVQNVYCLELNEINFTFVQAYVERGFLPHFAKLMETCAQSKTTSEQDYQDLEPWIQWVTAHTGQALAEHGVFRLGDIVNHDVEQIWECLEAKGLRVGAVSPMNAENKTKDAAFFVPDPWTQTTVTGGFILRKLYGCIAQIVNGNASGKFERRKLFWLLLGGLRYARLKNYMKYFSLVGKSLKNPWSRALLLDLLLSDVFLTETRQTSPNFATLFLNAGAHIQHHYLFSSAVYDGEQQNPEWYISKGIDPVFEVYALYDEIIGQMLTTCPDARLMIMTGLHQDPYPKRKFYWRLIDHRSFLEQHKVPFRSVEPRMSRDFLVICDNKADALLAQEILSSMTAFDGVELFEVDNRGRDLFVMFTYPNEVTDDFSYTSDGETFADIRSNLAFVAIKNGEHNGIGYMIDTGRKPGEAPGLLALKDIPEVVCEALGIETPLPVKRHQTGVEDSFLQDTKALEGI